MEETLWWSAFGMCLVGERSRKKRKSKRKWSRDWLMKKQVFSHITLLDTLRDEPNDWRNYLRMGEDTYMELLNLVSPLIRKQDTVMRKSISPHEKLTFQLKDQTLCISSLVLHSPGPFCSYQSIRGTLSSTNTENSDKVQ